MLEKVLSGVKHVRLDMTARDKGAPDKGHTTLFSSSKVVHYFPNFRSYFGMEYEQPWNMGKVLLEFSSEAVQKAASFVLQNAMKVHSLLGTGTPATPAGSKAKT